MSPGTGMTMARITPTTIGTRLPKRRVRVKPDRNGDATDERLHCCETRRWQRGREERVAQQEETMRAT